MQQFHDELNNDELNELFARYKAAVPDPDPSANFMPQLWRNIEARQTLMLRVRKLTQVFVGAAHPEVHASYVDALAAAHPADNLVALGIVARESK
jgi:hypothetical protein